MAVIMTIHLMIVIFLIGVVLLQKSEGGGLGMGGGAGFMSSRGTANLLTRATAFLAAGFFVTSLGLSWYAGFEHRPTPIIGQPAAQTEPASGAPATPPSSGGVLDTLKQTDQQNQAPASPQVPRSQ